MNKVERCLLTFCSIALLTLSLNISAQETARKRKGVGAKVEEAIEKAGKKIEETTLGKKVATEFKGAEKSFEIEQERVLATPRALSDNLSALIGTLKEINEAARQIKNAEPRYVQIEMPVLGEDTVKELVKLISKFGQLVVSFNEIFTTLDNLVIAFKPEKKDEIKAFEESMKHTGILLQEIPLTLQDLLLQIKQLVEGMRKKEKETGE